MALTPFQRSVCQLLAERRRNGGESYVAGGVALTVALDTHRVSRDLDLFHDTTEAVARSWELDRTLLEAAGYTVDPLRERPGLVEATVSLGGQRLLVEWARDSAFRFFPLVTHEELGLMLHAFDLATNKVLALVGRLEVRDWVDVVSCDERLQPLGYLAWAACAKDPGFAPPGILDAAARSSRYTDIEISALAFDGAAPTAADLSRRWHASLRSARGVIEHLPVEHVGQAVLTADGDLFRGTVSELVDALARNLLRFHPGRIGGALPQLKA